MPTDTFCAELCLTAYPSFHMLDGPPSLLPFESTYHHAQSYNELKDGVAAGSTLGILVDFLYLFVASLALGMLFGLGTAFLLKFLHSDSSPQEVRAAASVETSRGINMVFTPCDRHIACQCSCWRVCHAVVWVDASRALPGDSAGLQRQLKLP